MHIPLVYCIELPFLHTQIHGSTYVTLPLSLLVPNAACEQRNASAPMSLSSGYHELTNILSHELLGTIARPVACPYTQTVVQASVCSAVTRSKLVVVEEGVLRWRDIGSFAEKNCSIPVGVLPADVFLGRAGSYTFIVHFRIDLHLIGQIPYLNFYGLKLLFFSNRS